MYAKLFNKGVVVLLLLMLLLLLLLLLNTAAAVTTTTTAATVFAATAAITNKSCMFMKVNHGWQAYAHRKAHHPLAWIIF